MRSGTATTSVSPKDFAAWVTDPARRAALVIAHPAHEIRVFHWLSCVRPHTYILTQGSRSGADSTRRHASECLIEAQGATIAKTWGGVWDRDLYGMLLNGEHAMMQGWADELAADFIARDIDLVVADNWQHYNVAHDLTYALAFLATERAKRVMGREITLVTYPVVPAAMTPGAPSAAIAADVRLPDTAAAVKSAAIAKVPGIASESADIDASEGADAYLFETFHQALPLADLLRTPRETPLYEVFGEQRVQAGIYTEIVRWPHLLKACEALVKANSAAAQAA